MSGKVDSAGNSTRNKGFTCRGDWDLHALTKNEEMFGLEGEMGELL